MSLRDDFPAADSDYLGGQSDGYCYETSFRGGSLAATYDMIRAFLEAEGYADVPIPKDADELALFRLRTRNKQILLFEDNGYVHNPVKILFPADARQKNTLILKLYNEQNPAHLVRFHGVLE